MVDPQVRDEVEQDDVARPDLGTGVVQHRGHDQESQIGDGDGETLRGSPQRADGVEVARRPGLGLAVGPALRAGRGVGEQVQLPAAELVADQLQERDDGGLLGEMLELLDAHVLLLRELLVRPRHEDGVLLHVASVPVVAGVGDLPGEVRDEQEGMGGPADEVVDALVGRERPVAAFVSQNPHPCPDAALEEAVCGPGEGAKR